MTKSLLYAPSDDALTPLLPTASSGHRSCAIVLIRSFDNHLGRVGDL